MRRISSTMVLMAGFLIALPISLRADVTERHQELMSMTVREIVDQSDRSGFDVDAAAHAFVRCSIMSRIMAETLEQALPEKAPREMQESNRRLVDQFLDNADSFGMQAARLMAPEDQRIDDLFAAIRDQWQDRIIEAAIPTLEHYAQQNRTSPPRFVLTYDFNICAGMADRL